MRPALLALLLAGCGGATAAPPDARPPDTPLADAPPPDACIRTQTELCNPPACPDESHGPVLGACAPAGLRCSTGEFATLCVDPENVWVECTDLGCAYTGERPRQGDPCCKEGFNGSDVCTEGCAVCQCTEYHHWSCHTDACPDAG